MLLETYDAPLKSYPALRSAPNGQRTAQRGVRPQALRETPDGSAAALRDITSKNGPAAVAPDDPEAIVCRSCRMLITRAAERIMVQGAHEHTCANPAGLLYRIGCFRAAECSYAGEPTQEWTWFRGFAWQVAICRHCCRQVGWRFSAAGREFHGLILDRLCAEPHGMP
jgi:hypothetical protein